MVLEGGLHDAAGLFVRIRHHDMAQLADGRPAGEFRLVLGRAAALLQRRLVMADVDLGVGGAAIGGEMHALLARPGGADLVRGAIPEGRIGPLQGAQGHGHVGIFVIGAVVGQLLAGQALH